MTTGDRLRVFPLGVPDQTAVGVLVLCSGNARSLAISFGEGYVPFMNGATGMASHPEHGKMLLLSKMDDGSWHSVFGGEPYEVEPYPAVG
jgi:hypothetical protein